MANGFFGAVFDGLLIFAAVYVVDTPFRYRRERKIHRACMARLAKIEDAILNGEKDPWGIID